MSSILESPSVRQRIARHSVEAYHTLSEMGLVSERTELLRGVIVEKMTKTPLHVFIVDSLYELARCAATTGQVVRKEEPLTLSDSEPEPDIAIVHGTREEFRRKHPATALLAIEVSVTTEEADREKMSMYAEAGVAEFWLVLPAHGTIEIFVRPVQGNYSVAQVCRKGEVAQSQVIPALRVDVSQLLG